MKTTLIQLLILTVLIQSTLFASGLESRSVRMITREEIEQSGLMRLGNIFLLMDDWDISSNDGITWQASPLALNSFLQQEWKIFINGQPIDISFWGSSALDRIPIDFSQIDSVLVISQPEIHSGQKTTGGLIDIYTKRYKSDLSLELRTGFGNEIGDPGPYRNTDLSTSNVDKIGNIIGLNLYQGTKELYRNFTYKRNISYPTDKAMFSRNMDIAENYYPRQILESFNAGIGEKWDGFGYSISAAQSEFADFFFLRQYGREIPVNSKLKYFAGTAAFGKEESSLINCRIVYSSNLLGQRENSLNLDFDWKQEQIRANIETNFSKSKISGTIGIGLNHFSVSSGYIPGKGKITEGLLYGKLNYPVSKKVNTSVDWILNFKKDKIGYLAVSKSNILLGDKTVLVSAISYSRTLPEESNSLWYWQEQGYGFLEDNGVDYGIEDPIKPSKKITAEVSVINKVSSLLSIKFSGYYRSFSQIICEAQFLISQSDYSAPDNLIVKSDCSGQIIGGKIEADICPINNLNFGLSTRFQKYITDDPLFEENWNTIPKVCVSGIIKYLPVENFSILSRVKYRGPTKWVDYDISDDVSSGEHNSIAVKNIFSVDITAQKHFQNRNIRANFSIRNLFNRKLGYSPVGAQFDLSYFAQLEFLVN